MDRGEALVLNIGAGVATSIRELALLFQSCAHELAGREVRIIDTPAAADKTWPDRYTTIDKARSLFPWYPAKTLEEGVREIVIATLS